METFTQGIFLNEFQVEDNKWQLTFLNKSGRVLKLYANGLGNINSKNRNNLKDYSFVELEYFASRSETNNNGKLKKVVLLETNKIKDNNTLFIWNLIKKIIILENDWNSEIFNFILKLIREDFVTINDLMSLLVKIMNVYNFYPELNKCSQCGSNQSIFTLDLLGGGLICKNCKESQEALEAIHIINLIEWFNDNNVLLDSFELTYLKNQFINFFDVNLGINIFELRNIN